MSTTYSGRGSLRIARMGVLFAVMTNWLACGGDPGNQQQQDSGMVVVPPGNKPVGANCAAASECASPTNPSCIETIAPLQGIPEAQILDHSAYDPLSSFGLTFADGYCSSVPNCASNADCAAQGECFAPFRNVTDTTLTELAGPLGVTPDALDFLPSYGVCLRACNASTDCESGQLCEPPLPDLIGLVPDSVNTRNFCVPCEATDTDPNCTVAGAATVEIGGACTMDSECKVRGTARCLDEVHPLMSVLPPGEFLAAIGLDFPRGYCSNEANCIADFDCGPHGKCLAPFRNVTDSILRELEGTFSPPLASGELDFLPPLGVCLRSCIDDYECFADQSCQVVMDEFISQVPGSENDDSYCVPHPDCRYCSSHATCVSTSVDEASCVCDPGYTGNGLVCTPTGNGACAANPCQNGGTCNDSSNGGYTCLCAAGYVGSNCQVATACNPNPCQNGGTCTANGASPVCDCPDGYGGASCETRVTCPNLFIPSNGTLNASSLEYGVVATYGCNVGYTLSGSATRTCGDPVTGTTATWSGSAPTCNAANPCNANPCVDALATCTPGSGSNYTCSCPTGYTYNTGTDTCDPTPCSPNPCGSATCTAGSGLNYTCSCPVGSSYNGGTKACDPVNCGAPTGTSANGMVSTANGTEYNDVATYTCNLGYTLNGSSTRTCQANGTWSGSAPGCTSTASSCTTMPCMNNGICTSTGPTTRTCDCTGTGYTGTSCQTIVNCGAPTGTDPNGTVTTAGGTDYNDTAMYACNSNYSPSGGDATRTCQANGTWSGTPLTCAANNPCQPNPCGNGGTCSATGPSTYSCACSGAWTGMTCTTPVTCTAPAAPTNGAVTPSSGTVAYNASATYSCNPGYAISGTAARVCNGVNTWATAAPTCVAASCGTHVDVIYRLTARFENTGTTIGAGDQTFNGLGTNLTTPNWVSATNVTPFTGSQAGGTYTAGFARLRFPNTGTGATPVAGSGSVSLVEWYLPLEFTQTKGATVVANTDHSCGIFNNPRGLTNCGGGDATCMNHAPTINRTCTSRATGSLSGTALTWGTCSPATTGSKSWDYVMARAATGAGCAADYVQFGNTASSSGLVPASGKGDNYQVYNQQLAAITFSSTTYLTATWTTGRMQIPNGTGSAQTYVSITAATPIGTDCGTTPATDLVCNVQ